MSPRPRAPGSPGGSARALPAAPAASCTHQVKSLPFILRSRLGGAPAAPGAYGCGPPGPAGAGASMGSRAIPRARNPPKCRGPEDGRRRLRPAGARLGPCARAPALARVPLAPRPGSCGRKSLTVKPLGPDNTFADYNLAPPERQEEKGHFFFSPWRLSLSVGRYPICVSGFYGSLFKSANEVIRGNASVS